MKSVLRLLPMMVVVETVSAGSVAREWNEQNLAAIRSAFPDPPVHARNLFHVSVAMYDAWAAYDEVAVGYLHREGATVPAGLTKEEAREEAVSYAAYRVLVDRYLSNRHPFTPASAASAAFDAFNVEMASLGYSIGNTSVVGESPAAVGNRVAATVLAYSSTDDSRESTGYDDPTYAPVNQPLIVARFGTTLSDPNRWQPLAFDFRVTQNGIIANQVQTFVGAHWGDVRPFALSRESSGAIYFDPGTPPLYGSIEYAENNLEVIEFSRWLDPDDGVVLDYSPGSIGNNTLGENDGAGHTTNPFTGRAYEPNPMKRGDFGRVVAEFWADGPDSETPPGHWNTLANEVAEHPNFARRFRGVGVVLGELEWDVKMYFVLNGALHDAAVATWNCKREYDYVRPISSIRYLGQRNELPIQLGEVEIITAESVQSGERHEHLFFFQGQTAIRAWGGEPIDPETEYSGTEWILASSWLPYQRDTFVTPAFAGYTSGHSAFSRAAAEVLTLMTGSEFFPGGMGTHTVAEGELEFEYGPSEEVTLQWATYYDAADQAGISRLYGGIHVAPDDGPGRIVGSQCAVEAWAVAQEYFDGRVLSEEVPIGITQENGTVTIEWEQDRGMYYQLWSGSELEGLKRFGNVEWAEELTSEVTFPAVGKGFFWVERLSAP
ncbi:MAG: vanadium-dependent haloperoxidase [Verrucomicrobiota bacterium]